MEPWCYINACIIMLYYDALFNLHAFVFTESFHTFMGLLSADYMLLPLSVFFSFF